MHVLHRVTVTIPTVSRSTNHTHTKSSTVPERFLSIGILCPDSRDYWFKFNRNGTGYLGQAPSEGQLQHPRVWLLLHLHKITCLLVLNRSLDVL